MAWFPRPSRRFLPSCMGDPLPLLQSSARQRVAKGGVGLTLETRADLHSHRCSKTGHARGESNRAPPHDTLGRNRRQPHSSLGRAFDRVGHPFATSANRCECGVVSLPDPRWCCAIAGRSEAVAAMRLRGLTSKGPWSRRQQGAAAAAARLYIICTSVCGMILLTTFGPRLLEATADGYLSLKSGHTFGTDLGSARRSGWCGAGGFPPVCARKDLAEDANAARFEHRAGKTQQQSMS